MHAVSDYCGVALTLKDTETFKLDYAHASKVTKGDGWAVFATSASNLLITIPPCRFYIASDDAAKCERQHTEIIAAFAGNAEDKKKSGQFFFNKTRELIEKNSYSVVGGKVVNVDIVRDVLPFLDVEPAKLYNLQDKVTKDIDNILKRIKNDLTPVPGPNK